MMTNCPNCGAPITKPVCEYCGTVLAEGGLVEHDTIEMYSDEGLTFVYDVPKPSEEMKRAVAADILSMNEARMIMYG